MTTVGLIGVGTIGKKFAERLSQSELEFIAYDIDEEQLKFATERGAEAAENAAHASRTSDVVLLSLPSTQAVVTAMEADGGVLEQLGPDTVVVDTGTTKPSITRRYERLCQDAGGAFLEAPLTRAGNITMMIGGEKPAYETARPVFDVIAGSHRRIGDVGHGQVLKLMRQIIGAAYDAGCAEAIEFGRDNGVEPELLNTVLDMGVDDRFFGPEEEFVIEAEGGVGAMTLRQKDLAAAVDEANEQGAALPVTNVVTEAHKTAARNKRTAEPWFHEGIVNYWRVLNDRDDV